MVKTCGINSVK